MKVRCSWSKPLEIGGLQTKADELTIFEEIVGTAGTDRTYVVGTMSNGDEVFVRTQCRRL
jgi:hypothetical protein